MAPPGDPARQRSAGPPPDAKPPSAAGPQRRGWPRLATLLALVVALAISGYALPLRRVPDAVGHMGAVAPLAGVATGALLLCALIPRTAVSLACGLLFGALAGGVIALIAAVLAACATFAIGRVLGRDAVVALERARGARGSAARLDAWLARRGWWGVTLVRMMPLAPFGLIGYAYGTTSVRWRNYLGGTAIGATPSAFSYAGLGAAVVRPDAVRWVTFAPATVGLMVAVATFVYWRKIADRGDR